MGGIFGVTAHQDCVMDVFYGTDYHSHLGTKRGGIAVRSDTAWQRVIHNIENTQFRSKFEDDIGPLHGRQAIGVISDLDDQPLIISSHLGTYGIVTVGRINNLNDLARVASDKRVHFSEMSGSMINPTEVVATLINQGDSFADGIAHAQERIEGSCSLLLLTEEGIYAARDRFGRTSLATGHKEGAWAVTMETCALPNLDFELDRFLGPGEIVRLTADGTEQMKAPGDKLSICAFLWVYYGYPASSYEGINAEAARNRCGAALAKRDNTEVDVVGGIPDSGTAHAIGYANESGHRYGRAFVKYTPTWPRSFMPQDQRQRNLIARMKLIPVKELIEGQRLLFCDDSIVRGTQLQDTVARLRESGAKEVHMRPACPPLVHGCPYLNFSRSRSESELAARQAIEQLEGPGDEVDPAYTDPDSDKYQAMVDAIRERLDLDTLQYQRLDDLIDAIGLPGDQVCTYCWNKQG